jgi:hypothetical protein
VGLPNKNKNSIVTVTGSTQRAIPTTFLPQEVERTLTSTQTPVLPLIGTRPRRSGCEAESDGGPPEPRRFSRGAPNDEDGMWRESRAQTLDGRAAWRGEPLTGRQRPGLGLTCGANALNRYGGHGKSGRITPEKLLARGKMWRGCWRKVLKQEDRESTHRDLLRGRAYAIKKSVQENSTLAVSGLGGLN